MSQNDAPASPLRASPTAIGPYRPIRLLGSGGMAAVYLCEDEDGAKVAIKWLERSSSRVRVRFAREVDAMRRLEHPGVVPVLDQGVWEGRPYMVMRYIPGRDLRVYATKLQLRPPAERAAEVRRIGIGICEALEAVHSAGLVHRDIKPSNLLLDDAGAVYLADFGVVKDPEAAHKTAAGVLIGTAGYASPEQIRGLDVDHRADLYGLGGALYYLITGQRPYPGRSRVDVTRAHLEDPVPQPSTIDPHVPPDLESVVTRLLAKSPEDRFQSAAAVRAALERARVEGPSAAPPLAGRQRHVDRLRAALSQVQVEGGLVVQILGPQGSGRRWLAEVAEDLSQRLRVPMVVARDSATLETALERIRRQEGLAVVTWLMLPAGDWRCVRVHLEPLGVGDLRRTVVSLAPRTSDPSATALALHRLTAGHPAWLLPLLESSAEASRLSLRESPDIPTELRRAVEALPFESAEALGALAAIGKPVRAETIEEIAQVSARPALELLRRRALVTCRGDLWWIMGGLAVTAALENLVAPDATRRRVEASLALRPALTHDRAALERSYRLALQGRLEIGLSAIEQVELSAWALDDGPLYVEALRVRASILLDLGALRRADARFADAVAAARAISMPQERRLAHALRALTTLEAHPGNPTAAASAIDRVGRALRKVEGPDPMGATSLAHAIRARASASLGDRWSWERADRTAESALSAADPEMRARAEVELARAALLAGERSLAIERATRCSAATQGFSLLAWCAARVAAAARGDAAPELSLPGASPASLALIQRRPVA